ncbi:hypothetical protein K503DRAFT_443722 [Rhizopogon vinicolor AM-OR11-026]|uniref:Uncharacterized protein n=1 Tax=Rhizopogon vinicolor AM-OR11-026 TaxID=1314800 RepID=A0A1B7MPB6_9AGAM|nr:hypothetical protein K503DRAFT_443722 [Rhizopogon vinicolor AM-OR11-026]
MILGEAASGRNELLLNPNVIATRRPDQQRENAHRLPPGFFDNSPHHPHSQSPGIQRPSPSSAGQHHAFGWTLLHRVSSLFRRTHHNIPHTPPRPHFPNWVRNPFSGMPHRRHDEIELQERRPTVVDVPFTKGRRRSISAAEIRFEEIIKAKKASAGCSRPPQSSVTQSGGVAQTQPNSQLHAAAPPVHHACPCRSFWTYHVDDLASWYNDNRRWTLDSLYLLCVCSIYWQPSLNFCSSNELIYRFSSISPLTCSTHSFRILSAMGLIFSFHLSSSRVVLYQSLRRFHSHLMSCRMSPVSRQ